MHPITDPQRVMLAGWTQIVYQSTIQQLLAVATQPDILSFAPDLPAIELFPTTTHARAVAHVLATQPYTLQYCFEAWWPSA